MCMYSGSDITHDIYIRSLHRKDLLTMAKALGISWCPIFIVLTN